MSNLVDNDKWTPEFNSRELQNTKVKVTVRIFERKYNLDFILC